MVLSTSYLGLPLESPLVASAGPLSQSVDGVRELADGGVAAVVLYSLFEEQLRHEAVRDADKAQSDSFVESLHHFPTRPSGDTGLSRSYLDLLERSVDAVDIPVIASLNGSQPGSWATFARQLADAGAAAIELNIYLVPGDLLTSGRAVEDAHVEILHSVKESVDIPVAVKLAPYFSSFGEVALRLEAAGADGLVLFNRFLQPDIDIEKITVTPGVGLSSPSEGRLPRTWIAALRSQVSCSLAGSSGVETSDDVVQYLLAGADVVMTTSALLRHGPAHAATLLRGLETWLRRKGYDSVDEIRGLLSVPADLADVTGFARAGYVAALERVKTTYGHLH